MQRAAVILKELPVILVKIVIFLGVAIFYTLRTIFHLFVPKTPEDIRGRLAVVSSKFKCCYQEIPACFYGTYMFYSITNLIVR